MCYWHLRSRHKNWENIILPTRHKNSHCKKKKKNCTSKKQPHGHLYFWEFRRFIAVLCGDYPSFTLSDFFFPCPFLILSLVPCLLYFCFHSPFSLPFSFDSHLNLCPLAWTGLWSLALFKANECIPFKINSVMSSHSLLKLLGMMEALA